MRDAIIIAVASTVALVVLAWLAKLGKEAYDRRRVYRWLRSNTRDEPGESHMETTPLAKGTRLPEDRVRRACMSDRRIHRAPGASDLWSVWRAEPQSIYEKQGLTAW